MQQIANGDADIIVAGGQESMSMAPHVRASAQRHQDGRLEDRRHHDQGRPVGRLQRLPHGQHRRERRQASGRSPATSRTSSRRLAEQGRGRAEGRPFKDEIVPVTIKTRKGDVVVDRTSTSAPAPRWTRIAKLRPPSTRKAR
jgi:acetyl-CoA C-acetyltransferase